MRLRPLRLPRYRVHQPGNSDADQHKQRKRYGRVPNAFGGRSPQKASEADRYERREKQHRPEMA